MVVGCSGGKALRRRLRMGENTPKRRTAASSGYGVPMWNVEKRHAFSVQGAEINWELFTP